MRRRLALILVPGFFLVLAAAFLAWKSWARDDFFVEGTVTVSPRLEGRAARPNTVLFLVARSRNGIPVAVKRIVNPRFPMPFRLGQDDLLLPGKTWSGPLRLQARVTRHGYAHLCRPGDLEGEHPSEVEPGESPVPIKIDRVRPKLRSRRKT